ncbi:OLC1v1021898C1 [Oldenlandia corymbosa var. corymbosa]|uniref:peroxidase n=1 Tax=Oldenlandia corymbosa var. corymbosa TaxID=529605 RepID=A0AAV1BWP6_OLDCO|nr:OLC1v1021898C1 [Oldenlandia corymbosa var. corymbosa]
MAPSNSRKLNFLLHCLIVCLAFVALINKANGQSLSPNYYDKSCPAFKSTVKTVIDDVMSVAKSLAGPLLRMHFHDCFVRGCDGSVLLDTPNVTEKYGPPNLSLRGFGVIDRVKTAVERVCPGVVSCADIVALVAKDVTVATNGPSWEVEFGRKDGKTSLLAETINGNLLPPSANINALKQGFLNKGLSIKDLVVLSGSHTIGTSHCSSFDNRLYNFTGKGLNNDSDPKLDPNYVVNLKKKCKHGDQTTLVEMDPGSFKTFDKEFYTLVAKRRGLFHT